jgi:hypothetical protein
MKGPRSGALALAILVTSAAAVFADPIIITVDRRSVAAASPTDRSTAVDSDTLVATAGHGRASATLASSFTNPLHWVGDGEVNLSPTVQGFNLASSHFEVDFTVTAPVTYTFDGSFEVAAIVPDGCGLACSVQSFTALQIDTGRDEDGEINGPALFSFGIGKGQTGSAFATRTFTGLLMPGKYAFSAATFTNGQPLAAMTGSVGFTFDFAAADTAPIPEPASLLLLGTGLAGLFGYRSRAKNRGNSPSASKNEPEGGVVL